jgi:predicted ATPase
MSKLKRKIIEVNITDNGKSLKNFHWNNVPDFAVIVGLNGSGKTQLIDFISINVDGISFLKFKDDLIIGSNFMYYQKVYNKPVFDEAFREGHEIERNKIGKKRSLKGLRQSALPIASINETKEKNGELNWIIARKNGQINRLSESYIKEIKDCVLKNKKIDDNISEKELLEAFFSLTDQEIDDYVESLFVSDHNRMQELKISQLFLDYKKRENELRSKAFDYNLSSNEQKSIWLKEELKKVYGVEKSPWEVINEILSEYGFGHKIKGPQDIMGYELCFEGDKGVKFSTLSSGEQIIFYLICSAYKGNGGVRGIRLVLMDEFDAHLNPELSRMFIDIVQNVFVKDFGAQVILTTHTPSTVAYTPDENLFWMNKGVIEKRNKSKILKDLTPGLLLLEDNADLIGELARHISKNKSILFLEGESDRIYFEKAIEMICPDLIDKFCIMNCRGVNNIKTFIEIAKQMIGGDAKNLIAIVDNDNAGKKCKKEIEEKGSHFFELQIPEKYKDLPKLFHKEEDFNYPIEFLLWEKFFDNEEQKLTDLGEKLFKKVNGNLIKKIKITKEQLEKELENTPFLSYVLKDDRDRSGSKIEIAKIITEEASKDVCEGKKIFRSFLPTIKKLALFT